MRLALEIDMDNDAFGNDEGGSGTEAARILQKLTVGWKGTPLEVGDEWTLMDYNGNRVGRARVFEN